MKKKLLFGTSGDAILLTMIKLVTTALGFVITRLLSQYLSVYDYGTYSQILLIVSTMSSLTILGMMDGVNYFYCSEQDTQVQETYISTIFALQCIVSTAAGTIILLLSEPLCLYLDNPDVGKLMVFAVLLPFLQNLLSMFQVLLVAVGKARMLAMRNLIVSLARLAAVIVVVTIVQNVAIILLTTVLLDLAQIIFFGWTLGKSSCMIRLRKVNVKLFKRILQYCVPMGVFVSLNALNRDLDKYLIALMTDTETLAIYANASKALPFDIIMHSFYTVLVPEITRRVAAKENEQARTLYKDFLEIGYLATVIPCCAALAVSPQLMTLFYSSKYISGLSVFCVYILVDMLQFTNITLILSAAGKTRTLMFLAGGILMLNAALDIVFYHWIGVLGPALATLAVTLLLGVMLLVLGAKELGTRISKFFDMKFLGIFVLENIILLGLLIQLRRCFENFEIHYILIIIVICVLYCVFCLLLHGRRLVKLLKRVNSTVRQK